MIAGLLVRIGLGALAPHLITMALGSLVVGGGAAAWFVGWTDWKTAGLLVLCLVLVGLLFTSESKAARVLIALVVGVTLYAKGRIDEGLTHDNTLEALAKAHQVEIATLRGNHAQALKTERERQETEGQKALLAAAEAKESFTQAKAQLKLELDRIKEGAKHATDADYLVFNADDIADLNRLRYDPAKRKGRGSVRSGPTKHKGSPKLDGKALPAPAKVRGYVHEQETGKGSRGPGREVVRAVPTKAPAVSQACQGEGCSIKWRGF